MVNTQCLLIFTRNLPADCRHIISSRYLKHFLVHQVYQAPPGRARLNQIAGAWQPSRLDLGQWIQVDLGEITMVTKIANQGRQGGNTWVSEYKVSYSFGGGYFKFYRRASNISFDQVGCEYYNGRASLVVTQEIRTHQR